MSISKLYKAFGFSLIELMVVIAIVSILAVVSIPSYYSYINRTKIAKSVNVASYWMNEALTDYLANDTMPSEITPMSSTVVYTNTYILGDTDGPYAIYYWRISNTSAHIWVSVAGLSSVTVPSLYYVDPTTLPQDIYIFSNAWYSLVAMGVRINNGIAEFQCGTRTTGDFLSIPLDLMPSTCTCANVTAWTAGGAC